MSNSRLPSGLLEWARASLEAGENILARDNQGTVLLYQQSGREFVIKTAMGRAGVRHARHATLKREFAAYQRLEGVAGIPRCYGMLDDRYLVLEYIRGTAYRQASWTDRDAWFARLLETLQACHQRGVSHGDLKSKSNLIVTNDEQPCVIDFGTVFIKKTGFHPVNNWFFEYGKRLDINAWVKHKYHGHYSEASESDRELLNYSWIEYWVRKLRGRPMHQVAGTRKGGK
jgi:predicted Ser/Thr protein kinase